MQKQDYYNDFFEIGQQKINFSFFELSLPDDDPVYTLKKVMEELDFSGLLACYSDKGRTGFNPIMLYSVVTYANMRGVRAVDRIVDLCRRDLAFIWLTKGQKPQRDVFYDFFVIFNGCNHCGTVGVSGRHPTVRFAYGGFS